MDGAALNGLDVLTDDAKGGLEVVGKQQWGRSYAGEPLKLSTKKNHRIGRTTDSI